MTYVLRYENDHSDPSGKYPGTESEDYSEMISDEAFSEEVHAISRTAFAVSYLILKNTTDCEDAVSEAILSAYERRKQLKKRDSFRAWFLQIVRNKALDMIRKQRNTEPLDPDLELPCPYEDRDRNMDLRDALLSLSEQQRNTLLLQQEGYTFEEIAVILGIPAGTVKSRLSRGKEKLRTLMEEYEYDK